MGQTGQGTDSEDMTRTATATLTHPASPALTHTGLGALHRCATDGTLELLYQPEVDLASGAIVAMEALLRWHHPQLGMLAPPAFLDLAEASGDIVPIGTWALREAAAEAVRWQLLPGATRRLWVNVSPTQVAADDFVELVTDIVTEHALPPGALGLEMAESTVIGLGAAAGSLLGALRRAGVALAVDDFSSWYATLGAIQALPIDAVKLCHRYVRGVGEDVGIDGGGDSIVATVITQAHLRGLDVVAEGVETWGEAARLTELGCDRAHGWLFSSAQRADKARWLLDHGTGWRVPAPRPSS